MKSFTAITAIALATSAIARPDNKLRTRQSDTCIVDTTSTGNPSDIQASINQWNNDVNAVNSFLNTALSLDSGSLGSAASSALLNAQDEPCQLATLSSAGASDGSATDAFTCAQPQQYGRSSRRSWGHQLLPVLQRPPGRGPAVA